MWEDFKRWITPSKTDWDWLESPVLIAVSIIALIVLILDISVWRP